MKEQLYNIWFSQIKGIGNDKKIELIRSIQTPHQLYQISKEEFKNISGIENKILDILFMDKSLEQAKKTMGVMEKNNIHGVSYFDDGYPKRLREIYNPPLFLYIKGKQLERDEEIPSVAIIGSRKGSAYGKTTAYEMAKKLSQYGVTVISGMAYGIDSYAHKGAVDNKGRTIAVLGCGVNVCYPKENQELMLRIMDSGSVISEYHPDTNPFPAYFPQRNRIISGLSSAVAIVEAGEKSGTLITAEWGLEQGKDIYALPGNINSVYSKGTNHLIKEGANPICSIDEFLADLNITNGYEFNELNLGKDESIVYKSIKMMQPVSKDVLAYKLDKKITEIGGIISILEIKGLVESTYAGIIAK